MGILVSLALMALMLVATARSVDAGGVECLPEFNEFNITQSPKTGDFGVKDTEAFKFVPGTKDARSFTVRAKKKLELVHTSYTSRTDGEIATGESSESPVMPGQRYDYSSPYASDRITICAAKDTSPPGQEPIIDPEDNKEVPSLLSSVAGRIALAVLVVSFVTVVVVALRSRGGR